MFDESFATAAFVSTKFRKCLVFCSNDGKHCFETKKQTKMLSTVDTQQWIDCKMKFNGMEPGVRVVFKRWNVIVEHWWDAELPHFGTTGTKPG